MPADSTPTLPKRALLLILVIVFVNFAGFSLIIPLLPFYGRELHANAVEVTLLFAAYSFGGILERCGGDGCQTDMDVARYSSSARRPPR